jgi:hypothetical protein
MKILTQKEFQADLAKMWSEAVHAEYKAQIEAAVLAEREACAKVCDRMAQRTQDIRSAALESAAENIRARGQA